MAWTPYIETRFGWTMRFALFSIICIFKSGKGWRRWCWERDFWGRVDISSAVFHSISPSLQIVVSVKIKSFSNFLTNVFIGKIWECIAEPCTVERQNTLSYHPLQKYERKIFFTFFIIHIFFFWVCSTLRKVHPFIPSPPTSGKLHLPSCSAICYFQTLGKICKSFCNQI